VRGAALVPAKAADGTRGKIPDLMMIICAENNYAFFDYGVAPLPRSDKPDF
jgi:hypothetical protein